MARNNFTIAAMLAYQNMGHGMPPSFLIGIASSAKSCRDAAQVICGSLIETDEHEEMLVEETESWLERAAEVEKTWPHTAEAYDEATR